SPMIGRTVSHYEILELLGQGGMGVVYRARDTRLDRTVRLSIWPRKRVVISPGVARLTAYGTGSAANIRFARTRRAPTRTGRTTANRRAAGGSSAGRQWRR